MLVSFSKVNKNSCNKYSNNAGAMTFPILKMALNIHYHFYHWVLFVIFFLVRNPSMSYKKTDGTASLSGENVQAIFM